MFDITPLAPEARSQVLQAAKVYAAHTRSWFVGLLAHGSALSRKVEDGLDVIKTESAFLRLVQERFAKSR